jgi:hypothetical protein
MPPQVKDTSLWERVSPQPLLTGSVPNFTHASHATAIHMRDDKYLLAYASRDCDNRSHLFALYANVNNGEIEIDKSSLRLVAVPGAVGAFDCDGILPCNFVKDGERIYLYYCGWQNLPNGRWICDSGRFLVDTESLSFEREFEGPIFGRDKDNPLFAVATAVRKQPDGSWIAWYNKGLKWGSLYGRAEATYGVHIAVSGNGVQWESRPGLVIPFLDDREHSIGRPCVMEHNGVFHMWFGCRGALGNEEYRIGYAWSVDGFNWTRKDSQSGIVPSGVGWDSDAVTYPAVFKHDGFVYLLYSGNGYGRAGFGYVSMSSERFSAAYNPTQLKLKGVTGV